MTSNQRRLELLHEIEMQNGEGRLEILKLAASTMPDGGTAEIVKRAQAFATFVSTRDPAPSQREGIPHTNRESASSSSEYDLRPPGRPS
jgi:hypothetical protein